MYPENVKYTKEHEWVRVENGTAVVGITDYAQEQLGDVVYVELPDMGAELAQFSTCGTIESVKTVSDLYAPVSGEVVKINEELDENPELINDDPYGAGWILEVTLSNPDELGQLLSAGEYEAFIKENA
ncbi:glycine cleavage system H protein [Candidatus Vecturithrix granuli]|uniref:Glycine cleavage system H protein n=1 Tax=Vecturithrix granuli TaxID=1499967 RepID=A0A081C768_VECG1|nr:glycine cleavage system H protein [Candidatus Vecturithrix granuli]